jgi:hypothetical protein
MKVAAAVFSALMASMGQCQSSALTGNDLREECQIAARGPKNEGELAKATYCQGFVTAILFTGSILNETARFCAPHAATVGQTINVFLKYLNDNPDRRGISNLGISKRVALQIKTPLNP